MTRVLAMARGAYRAAFSSGPGYEPQPLGRHARDDRVAGYFLDFRAKTLAGSGEVLNARGEALSGSPTATAQRALGWWERHLDREPGALSAFLAEAGRLRASAEPRREALLWRYATDVPKYGLRPPWCSAMAQGQAASVFVRAHAATGDDAYAEAALAATLPLVAPDLAKPFYHRLHVRQVAVMHRLTSDDRFAEAERSWRAYDRRRNAVRAVAGQARRLLLS